MTYDELTITLPKDLADAFILSPGYIGADSIDLVTFIETVWKAPVTVDNYKQVAQSFRAWYREHAPNEYHDPPTEAEIVAWGWGGKRPGSGRQPGDLRPRGRNFPNNPNGAQIPKSVRLDPDVYAQVETYATANGLSFNAAINAMLAAI